MQAFIRMAQVAIGTTMEPQAVGLHWSPLGAPRQETHMDCLFNKRRPLIVVFFYLTDTQSTEVSFSLFFFYIYRVLLSVCVCLCPFVCLYVSVCVSVCHYLCSCLYFRVYLGLCVCVHVRVCDLNIRAE